MRSLRMGRRAATGLTALCTASPAVAVDQLPIFGSGGRLDKKGQSAELDLAESYAANPVDISGLTLPPICRGAQDVALVFVGSGGPDRETAAMEAALRHWPALDTYLGQRSALFLHVLHTHKQGSVRLKLEESCLPRQDPT